MSEIDNILFLKMVSNEGTIDLIRELPVQKLVLKSSQITWASTADSNTAGTHINIELTPFSSLRINSNRVRHIDALPIFNNVKSASTITSSDIPIYADRSLRQSFSYRIFDNSGNLVSNLTAVELIFHYSQKAVI